MLRNELLIYFPTQEFFSGSTIDGFAELRLAGPITIEGVYLDLKGIERVQIEKKTETNTFYSENMLLIGPGSKDRGRDW